MLQWEKAERSSIYSLVTSQLFNRNWGAFRCTMANGRWEFLNCVILKTKWGFLDCWGLGALFFVCRLYWCLEVERQRFLVISTGLSIIRTMWWGHNTRYVLSTTIRCAIGTKQSQTTRAHQRFFDWTIHKNHHRPRKPTMLRQCLDPSQIKWTPAIHTLRTWVGTKAQDLLVIPQADYVQILQRD